MNNTHCLTDASTVASTVIAARVGISDLITVVLKKISLNTLKKPEKKNANT